MSDKMECVMTRNSVQFAVDLNRPIDISIPIQPVVTPSAVYTHPTPTYAPPNAQRSTVALDAFGIPPATCHPLVMGSWVGAVHAGSSVNCWELKCCAHGNGTHTECVAHITRDPISIEDMSPAASLHPALLLSVGAAALHADSKKDGFDTFEDCGGDTYSSHARPTDRVISRRMILASLNALTESDRGRSLFAAQSASPSAASPVSQMFVPFNRCIVLRTNAWKRFTKPDAAATATATAATDTAAANKQSTADAKATATAAAASAINVSYSSRDPPYLTIEAAQTLVDTFGVSHLCVDLPSVDRESDGGQLLVHRIIFRYATPYQPPATTAAATTTGAATTAAASSASTTAAVPKVDLKSAAVASAAAAISSTAPTSGGASARRAAAAAATGPFTITELCHFSAAHDTSHVPDGPYLMNLGIAPIAMDAAPARPVLFPVTTIKHI